MGHLAYPLALHCQSIRQPSTGSIELFSQMEEMATNNVSNVQSIYDVDVDVEFACKLPFHIIVNSL